MGVTPRRIEPGGMHRITAGDALVPAGDALLVVVHLVET
jgi:hypothetical protein